MVEHEYPYRQHSGVLAGATVVSGALALGCLLIALMGDPAMGSGGGIFGAAFVLCAWLWRKRSRFPRRRVAFTASGLLLPVGWWRPEEKPVAYGDITDLAFVRLVGVASGAARALELRSSRDCFRIAVEDLGQEHFHEVCDLLLERVSPELARSVGPSFWLNEANHLDRHGEWARALAYYERAAEALGGSAEGEYARSCLEHVQEKMRRAEGPASSL